MGGRASHPGGGLTFTGEAGKGCCPQQLGLKTSIGGLEGIPLTKTLFGGRNWVGLIQQLH